MDWGGGAIGATSSESACRVREKYVGEVVILRDTEDLL
jgi:hypothetical protein